MQIYQAIFKIEKSISLKDCKKLTSYMDKKCLEKASIINDEKGSKVDTSQRDVLSHFLNPHDYGAKTHYDSIVKTVGKGIKKYMDFFPFVRRLHMSEINMLKYEKKHFFTKHIDATTSLPRIVSIIINLNEDYEGAELLFFNPNTVKPFSKLTLKTGDMVLFPSNFLYPHEITPLIKGTRYSIVCWLQ